MKPVPVKLTDFKPLADVIQMAGVRKGRLLRPPLLGHIICAADNPPIWDSKTFSLFLSREESRAIMAFLEWTKLARPLEPIIEEEKRDSIHFWNFEGSPWRDVGVPGYEGEWLPQVMPLDLLFFSSNRQLPVAREDVTLKVGPRGLPEQGKGFYIITDPTGTRESRLLFLLLIVEAALLGQGSLRVEVAHAVSDVEREWRSLFLAKAVCPAMYEKGRQEANEKWLGRMEGLCARLKEARQHAEESKSEVKSPHVAEAKKILDVVTGALSADNVAEQLDRLFSQAEEGEAPSETVQEEPTPSDEASEDPYHSDKPE